MAASRKTDRTTPTVSAAENPAVAPDARPQLVLASRSPRRGALLTQAGLVHSVEASGYIETPGIGAPGDEVVRHARGKARDVAMNHAGDAVVVLGADTAIVLGREMLGK